MGGNIAPKALRKPLVIALAWIVVSDSRYLRASLTARITARA